MLLLRATDASRRPDPYRAAAVIARLFEAGFTVDTPRAADFGTAFGGPLDDGDRERVVLLDPRRVRPRTRADRAVCRPCASPPRSRRPTAAGAA